MKHKFIELVKGEKRPVSYDTFYPSLDKLNDGGWLVGNKVVVIDFDAHNDEETKKLNEITDYILAKYPTFWIQATRGKHLYYKKPNDFGNRQIKSISMLGFPVDYLTGTKQVEVLKRDGVARKTSSDINKLDFDTLPELPIELYPCKKSKSNNMLCMKEGDRNNTLYKHLLNVKELSDLDLQSVAEFINNYVLSESLPTKELENTVESAKSKETEDISFYDNSGKLIVSKFAKFLIDKEHICKINGQLYIFNGQVYVTGNEYIEASMLKYDNNILSARRTEILKMIKLLLQNEKNKKYADPSYIAFKNGIYNIDTDMLLDFDPDIIITNQIPWNYNKDATKNIFLENVLKAWTCSDKQLYLLLEEVIGMTMYRSNKISSCFILTGDKDNGKSTFIWLLKALLGEQNYSSIGLHDIEKRFKNADIVGKLANLGDDIGDSYIAKTENFKKLVTGETIILERKGKDPFECNFYGKLIFNANSIPRIKDETGAVIDKRLIYLPFNATFSGKTKDINLKDKFDDKVMETLILIGIEGIKRVMKNKAFTNCDSANALKEEYKFINNPILQFIDEIGADNIYNVDVSVIYAKYVEFCKNNGFESKQEFKIRKEISKELNCNCIRYSQRIGSKIIKPYRFGDKND